MKSASTSFVLAGLLISLSSAQLLSYDALGTLPTCAQSCTILTSAQTACGGTTSDSTATWECFCPKVWAQISTSPSTICDTDCSGTDLTATYSWYEANCGSDNGASEHAASGTSASTTTTAASGSTGTASSSASASSVPTSTSNAATGGWFQTHWKWVVMLIVLAVGLALFAIIAIWLRKRHDRKQDQISGGFNSGITERAPPSSARQQPKQPPMATHAHDPAFVGSGVLEPSGSGRDSPLRTRDAFMPYGYGYTRSDSRLASSASRARGGTPVDELERQSAAGTRGPPVTPQKKSKRVLVRERSGEDS